MSHIPPELALSRRQRLPADLLDLLAKYPRESWPQDPHLAGLAEMWLSRHGLFRQLSGMIGKATSELREGTLQPDAFLPFFQRRMGLMLGELEGHHNIEDAHYFPAFAAAAPRLKRGFDILDADHHVIHEAIYSLAGVSRALIAALSGEVSGKAGEPARAADALAAEIARFDVALIRHLDDEEDLVIPLILERAREDPEFGG